MDALLYVAGVGYGRVLGVTGAVGKTALFVEKASTAGTFRLLAVLTLWVVPLLGQVGPIDDPFRGRDLIPQEEFDAVRAARVAQAVRISEPITLDGRMREAVWALAEPATDFIQIGPRSGARAFERTEVRFLYDDDNLYVGLYMFDSDPANITINDLRDDFSYLQSDAASIMIDSLDDQRSGFVFAFNPGGARRDLQVADDNRSNADWDGVWDLATMIDDTGWGAEVVIPFKTLRFSSDRVQEWGLQIQRRIPRLNEESGWSPVPVRFRGIRISVSGTLRGLEDLSPGRNVKVTPFATAGFTRVRDGDAMVTTRSLGRFRDYDGGVDAKFGLTPSLTLDTTYRTDFAQVEVDEQQVNLTRFNLFFPEKREFFLENAGTFNFGPGGNLLPFFSRRIGLSEDGRPIPILGGTRVSGQVEGYDLGFLAMKTQEARTGRGVVPSNDYVVGRVKRNFRDTSWVGGLFTSRTSAVPGDTNRVYGADAYFRFYDRLEFDAYLLGSDTPGRAGRNQARRFQTAWRDDELRITAQFNEVQENFNPEIGFVRRGNMAEYAGEFLWLPLLDDDVVRNLTVGVRSNYIAGSTSGEIETRVHEAEAGVSFENSASLGFTVSRTLDRLVAPTRIRGIRIPEGDYEYQRYAAAAQSNNARRVSGGVRYEWGEFWDGGIRSMRGAVTLRPNRHVNLELVYDRSRVELSGRSSTSDLAGARFLYAFTPRAFLNAFFQYNGATDEFSSNIRFNLRYRALSDIYVVYNDRRDTRRGHPVERAFIVKVTNLINF